MQKYPKNMHYYIFFCKKKHSFFENLIRKENLQRNFKMPRDKGKILLKNNIFII